MTKETINEIQEMAMKAIRIWRNAVTEKIMESGKTLDLRYDKEDEFGVEVYYCADNYLYTYYATKIRYNAQSGYLEIYLVYGVNKEMEEWQPLYFFSNDECDNIMDSIIWED